MSRVAVSVRKAKNAKARTRAAAKAVSVKAELDALLADESFTAKLAAQPSSIAWRAEQGETLLDDARYTQQHLARCRAPTCGAAGQARLLKRLKSS